MLYAVSPITNPIITGIAGKEPTEAFGKGFSAIIGLLLVGASIFTFFQLIQGGLSWISAGGDKGKLEEAQKRISNAVVGLFVVFGSWAVYLIIMQFFGISGAGPGLQLKIPTLF